MGRRMRSLRCGDHRDGDGADTETLPVLRSSPVAGKLIQTVRTRKENLG